MKLKTRSKFTNALSCVLATQLAFSMSSLAVFADSDALTNSSLPMPTQAPSKLVQRVWSSFDLRKTAKVAESTKASNKNDVATNNAKGEPVAVAVPADTSSADTTSNDRAENSKANKDEASTSSSGVVSTAQKLFTSDDENSGSAAASAQSIESAKANSSAEVPSTSMTNENSAADASTATKTPEKATEEVTSSENSAKQLSGAAAESSPAQTAVSSTEKTGIAIEKPAIEKSPSKDQPFKIASALAEIAMPPGSVLAKVQANDEGAVVVDNDEAVEVEETLKCEALPVTEDGKSHARAGARFPVVLASQVTSKTAKQGDPIKAHLKYDLKIGDRMVAKKGCTVNGHVNYVLHARTIMHSLFSPERWYRNSGCLGLSFDEIVTEKGEHLPLNAVPSRQARIVKNKAEGRELGVNHNGQVVGPWSEQIKYKALRIGLNAALAPAGVFSFGAMPLALGVLGAASPSFAFAKPVGLNVRHRRLKGFAWGFLSGVPGSWLIEDTTIKGQEAIVKPGDEFYAELVQEFTGEPATDAQLMPGSSAKVHGEVVRGPKKVKKKAQ